MNYDTAVTTCGANGMNLLNVNSVELEDYMLSYSNIQWPYGNFWHLGKNGTVCSTFSNEKKLFYFKTQLTCTNLAYFHCEYQSKLKLFYLTEKRDLKLYFAASAPKYKAVEEPEESMKQIFNKTQKNIFLLSVLTFKS